MDNLSQETDALTDWRDDLKTNFLHNAPELQDGKKKKNKVKTYKCIFCHCLYDNQTIDRCFKCKAIST